VEDKAKEFGTQAQIDAAKADMDSAATREEIIAAWKKHVASVGHKRLYQLLVGKAPTPFGQPRGE
jgi:hypothetical protein